MMKTTIINCTYCDHSWKHYLWSEEDIDELACPQCGDTELRFKEVYNTDVFGYNVTEDKNKK